VDDSIVAALKAGGLDAEACVPSVAGGAVWRVEVPQGHAFATWAAIAKAATETKVWPILRGNTGDVPEAVARDPAEVLAAAPLGNVRDVLGPRMEARRASLRDWIPEVDRAADMDQLAALADASGIHEFIGSKTTGTPWPADPPEYTRVGLQTLKGLKGKPSTMLLIQIEHSSDVPAHLGFGGWNDCPEPEVQVAVLREWRQQYRAVPAALTGDVLECVVVNRPQTEAEAMRLAAEQWIFCDDIVGQGTQSVRQLAIQIWRAPTWFFWWD